MLKPRRRHASPLIFVAALFILQIGAVAWADTADKPSEQPLINLDVKDGPIEQVLRMLAKAANVNIIIGRDVTGTIPTVNLRDVTVEQALRSIATSQGYYWWRDENVYMVSAQPQAATAVPQGPAGPVVPPQQPVASVPPGPAVPQPGSNGGYGQPIASTPPTIKAPVINPVSAPPAPSAPEPKIETRMIVLQHGDAEQLAYMFGGTVCNGGNTADTFNSLTPRNRLSRNGRGLSDAAGVFQGGYAAPTGDGGALGWGQDFGVGTGGYGGTGGGGRRGGRGGGNTGVGGQTGGIGGGLGTGRGAGAGGGGGSLGNLLPGDMQAPIAFLPQNALLVQGTQEDLDKFKEILDMLDKPSKQVEIATKFIEVQTTADNALGIDWSISNGVLEFFNQGFAPAAAVNNVVRFAHGRFEAQLNALLSSGRATVINEPHVTTMNNQFAEIEFDTTIPYFSATVSYNQFGTRQVDFTSDFIDVVNSLWVVPRINADDSITVYLEPELDDTVGNVTGPNGESIPIVTSQYVSTQVRVGDGETIVLGGLIRKDESTTLRETPLLSRIPIIGKLFRSNSVTKRNSELLIFVTPRIVRDMPGQ